MVNYRRSNAKGGSYFFTVNLRNKALNLLVQHIDVLRKSFKECMYERPFKIDAMVVLPNHLHTIWKLPAKDSDYSTRWRIIKSKFTKLIKKDGSIFYADERGEHGIWQRRFWEHQIRDLQDFTNHVDYIHYNPVKHGYVDCVKDWPHSSFHRFVRDGVIDLDWGSAMTNAQKERYGEFI